MTAEMGRLTTAELGDLAAAYGWWKAHGDPEAFQDALDAAVERIVREREAKARAEALRSCAKAWDEGWRAAIRGATTAPAWRENPYRADQEAAR